MKEGFTVWVFPHDRTPPRRFYISTRAFWGIVVTGGVLLGLALFHTIGYYYRTFRQEEFRRLRAERKELLDRVAQMGERLRELDARMQELMSKDKALRVLANLPEIGDDVRAVGTGGPVVPDTGSALSREASTALEEVNGLLDRLLRQAELERTSLETIERRLKADQILRDHTPSIKPCAGYYSSGFGMRRDPFTGKRTMHYGLDIANRPGTPIYATADGKVIANFYTRGLGRVIIIDHGYGYRTVYGHLRRTFVRKGQKVKRWQKIAEMGNSGRSTGPHLHYEVWHNGRPVNPINYIFTEDRALLAYRGK